jgi:PAS domain S-box-containing protein
VVERAVVRPRALGQDIKTLVFLVSGVALLFAAIVWLVYQALVTYNRAADQLGRDAALLVVESVRLLQGGDAAGSEDALNTLKAHGELRAVAIYDESGALFSKRLVAADARLPQRFTGLHGTRLDGTGLVHTRALEANGRYVGTLLVRTSLRGDMQYFAANVIVGAVVIAVVFGMALVFSMRLQRRIAEPIESVIDTARRLSRGEDYSLRAEVAGGRGELDELIQAFNTLIARIDQSNRELEDNTRYYMSLINQASDTLMVLGADGKVKFVNREVERMLGYAPEEITGRDPGRYVHAGDCDALREMIANEDWGEADPFHFEIRARHQDGEWRIHDVTATNLLGNDMIRGVVLNSRDITERKRIEQENRQTGEFLDAVFEHIPNMIFVKEAKNLTFVRVNRTAEELLGLTRDTLLGRSDYDFFPEEQADLFTSKDREVLRSGQVQDIPEERITTADKGEIIVHTKKVPLYAEDGTASYLLGIAEDITERKQAEQAVEVTEERYRLVVEHAADAFFVHDLSGRFVDVNRRACESLGYTREELLQMTVADIEQRFDAEKVVETWDEIRSRPDQIRTIQGAHRRKDGTTFPVEVRLARIYTDGRDCILALSRDVSVQREVEKNLRLAKESAETASRVKDQFFANMSHEIRTPMNAVIGLTDLLLKTQLTQRQREYVKTIRNSGDLLLSVIDDILDISKLEAGMELHVREFDLDDVTEGVLELLGYPAQSKHIELIYRCDFGIPNFRVIGDPNRLRQVLLNLIGNAVKFTDHGHVLLEISIEEEIDDSIVLRFAVVDTGVGFDEERKRDLFSPFIQVDSSTTRRHRGTGLGLTISKRLVEKMGGRIDVDSEAGHGSTFWFTVPFGKRDIDQPASSGLEGRRVLVVDSNPILAAAAADDLESLGMRADRGTDVSGVVDQIASAAADEPYDVVLLDSELLPVDGVSLARQIRARVGAAKPGIVIMTSVARPLHPGAISSVTNARCVSKPLLPRTLRGHVLELSRTGAAAQTAASGTAECAAPGEQSTEKLDYSGLSALVAEDNLVSREMLLDMLAIIGCQADAVPDGEAALRTLDARKYDLMLLDCQMPCKDGYEVAATVREREAEGEHMTIIAVTAHASKDDELKCRQAGIDDYLPKPVRLETLQRAMEKWFPAGSAAGSREMADGAPIEAGAMEAMRHDPRLLEKFCRMFIDDAETRLAELRDLVIDGRLEALPRAAHELRAGCLQIGAQQMAASCKSLEFADSATAVADGLARVEADFVQVRAYLEAESSATGTEET